ncbi:MAG TPA: hypothetical protein VLX92_33595 [Kofleriaceae bacterium]|nr:hypothetical protein [Kofleriaceae bacterium]
MGNFRSVFVIGIVAALAACGSSSKNNNQQMDAPPQQMDAPKQIDAKVFMDAPPSSLDFSCLGDSAPTTATDPITIAGTAELAGYNGQFTLSPLGKATVDACKGSGACTGGNILATGTTDMNTGTFSLSPVATGGVPLDGYLQMTATSDETIYLFPGAPLVANASGITAITFPTALITALSGAIPNCTVAGNGLIMLEVTDCKGQAITDATNVMVSVEQGGTAVTAANVLDLSMYAGSAAAGLFLVCNVPPGTTTIGAKYQSMTFLSHDITLATSVLTQTFVRPGY